MKKRSADDWVDDCYLEVRARILQIAADLDRIDRAGVPTGSAAQRRQQLEKSLTILLSDDPDRAAAIQHLFSRDYQSDWRENYGLRDSSTVNERAQV
ncbi:MAG: hypothetical protein AAGD07_15690 [Planctomycetota bacterium]